VIIRKQIYSDECNWNPSTITDFASTREVVVKRMRSTVDELLRPRVCIAERQRSIRRDHKKKPAVRAGCGHEDAVARRFCQTLRDKQMAADEGFEASLGYNVGELLLAFSGDYFTKNTTVRRVIVVMNIVAGLRKCSEYFLIGFTCPSTFA
jgi:hypothetical protein